MAAKVYTVAISPDGRLVAAGGWDAHPTENYIQIFDTITGTLVRRLGPMKDVIHELTFSPDGSRLAVGLGNTGGIRVWLAPFDGEPLADTDYGKDGHGGVYGLSFNRENRLVTTAEDFLLRLYDDRLQLLVKVKPPNDFEPQGAAFSPDGSEIAIGYYNAARVDIVDAGTLALRFTPDLTKLNNGTIPHVALVRGWRDAVRRRLVRYRRNQPRGGMAGARSRLTHDARWRAQRHHGFDDSAKWRRGACDGGSLLRCRGRRQPIPAHGERRAWYPSSRHRRHARQAQWQFLVRFGCDGCLVRNENGSADPWLFDVKRLALEATPQHPADYIEPKVEGLSIEDWINAFPTLNKEVLKLETYERSRSLAIAPDAQSFIIGTEWNIYSFAANGEKTCGRPPRPERPGVSTFRPTAGSSLLPVEMAPSAGSARLTAPSSSPSSSTFPTRSGSPGRRLAITPHRPAAKT